MNQSLFTGLYDFETTEDGDIVVVDGDISRVNGIDWFTQEVMKILKSSNDWYFAKNAGAALDQFHGRINSRETANNIKELIISKINRQRISFPAKLNVNIVPLSRDEIKIYITLEFGDSSATIVKSVFDLQNGILKNSEIIKNQQDTATPAKHPFAGRFL